MADKEISDLQLRSEVTDDVNFPVDDGIQTYRVTALQNVNYILQNGRLTSAMLNDTFFNPLTAVLPADDDYFPLVDTSDANKTKKGLVGSFRNAPYRSVTSTNTATSADETIKLSGASFTLTLPVASTAGKKIKLIHAGTNFTQVYTIATQGGALIGTVASGAYKLWTNGEVLQLESDGVDWIITGRVSSTGWISMGSMVINAAVGGTAPVKPTTSVDSWLVKRDGVDMLCKHDLTFSAAGSRTNGSGEYVFQAVPSSLTINQPFSTTTRNWNVAWLNVSSGQQCGGGGDASAQFFGLAVPYNATGFRVFASSQSGQSGVIGSGSAFQLGNDTINYHFLTRFPIVDFQP